jgi:hypothetical protein
VVGLSGIYAIDPAGAAHTAIFGADPDARRDASPVHQASQGDGRFLLLYPSDRADRADQARRMALALTAARVPYESRQLPVGEQGLVAGLGLPGDEATARLAAFVRTHRLPTPTPSPSPTPRPSSTPRPSPTATATPADAAPPTQPASGPGGRARTHRSAQVDLVRDGDARYRLYLPHEPEAPVAALVLFLGAATAEPAHYDAWLRHLARGGWAVAVPDLGTAPAGWPAAATAALAHARARVAPLAPRVAFFGHREGAAVAASLAASWLGHGQPPPAALFLALPSGDTALLSADLRRVPRDTRVLFVAAAGVAAPSPVEAGLWAGLGEIPGSWRQRLVLPTDRYGRPPLVADEWAPATAGAEGEEDALDWLGTWKWSDALLACSYRGEDCAHAFGAPDEPQLSMGRWADGRPVARARREDVPWPAPWQLAFLPLLSRR